MTSAPHASHLKYRPDIDGLRAIAVLAVVIYHLNPVWLPSGFIGVDIFFVISGYLIAGIIFKNRDENTFSFGEFYARRIRRIFPALLTILVFCLGLGSFTLLANEYKALGHHVFLGSLFYSNFTLLLESGYFDTSAKAKPLLHLWSLSVEEQFYLIWPLILAFVPKRKYLIGAILTGIVASFLLNYYLIFDYLMDYAFYLPFSRFWELLLGSLIAYLHRYTNFNTLPDKHKNTASICGVLLLVLSFFIIVENKPQIAWQMLLPVMGAALIISAGSRAFLNRLLLSNKPIIFIGLISYPLYLWHWPLLTFIRVVENQETPLSFEICAVILSFILAILTYFYIEKPVRFSRAPHTTKILLGLIIIVCALGYIVEWNKGRTRFNYDPISSPQNEIFAKDIKLSIRGRLPDASCPSFLKSNFKNLDMCLANSAKPEIVFLGDSHATNINVPAYVDDVPAKTLVLAGHGCLPMRKYFYSGEEGPIPERSNCYKVFDETISTIESMPSIKTIVLLSRGPRYFSSEKNFGTERNTLVKWYDTANKQPADAKQAFTEGYDDAIKRLSRTGKKIVFAIDFPEFGKTPRACVKRPFVLTPVPANYCMNERSAVDARQKDYRDIVKNLQSRNPDLLVYDPINVFCDTQTCHMKNENHIFYYDYNHLSNAGSKLLLEDFLRWNKKHS